jgi:hypothetical protein
MTDHDDAQHRAYHQPSAVRVFVRETDDDGVFVVRMPIASTGEVRNQGDEPLTRDELDGMAEQIEGGGAGVFLDHGSNMDISGSRYSAVGKVGEWQNPDLTTNDAGETLLEAEARMMDPETLSETTGSVREALSALKAQVDRDIGLSSSIGWRDDDSSPGGVDLMEASIVGIPADPRTTSQNAAAAMARAVVMGSDADQHRHLSAQQAETAETLLDAYRNEQGNGSVENFESWLWNVAYHQFDDNEFHAAQTALQEFYRETTPLEEPVDTQFIPFLDSQQSGDESGDDNDDEGGDARDSVTDSNTQSGDNPDNTNDDQDGMDQQEYRESMLEMQRQQTETLSALADSLREDDDGGDDDDDDDEDEGNEQSLDIDGDEVTAEDVREMREQLGDAEPDTDGNREADAEDEEPDDQRDADPKNLL